MTMNCTWPTPDDLGSYPLAWGGGKVNVDVMFRRTNEGWIQERGMSVSGLTLASRATRSCLKRHIMPSRKNEPQPHSNPEAQPTII